MRKPFVLLFVFLALFGLAGFVFASTEVGTISDGYKYGWGDRCGWLNFDATQGGVTVRDTGLSGYVWSENFGWINLAPPGSGVSNNNEGTLSGYAWGENTGWINFSGVVINSSGQFTGTASGDITGTISFSCDGCVVKTDWRAKSLRGGGGLLSGAYSAPSAPFSVLINDGKPYTNSLAVTLKLQAGSDTKRMAISESPSFKNAVQEDYQMAKLWNLSPGDGQKTIYARFYTKYGQASPTFSSSIILDTKPPEIAITGIKSQYSGDEEVVISGATESNAEVIVLIDDSYYGIFNADGKGDWLVTFGKMAEGKHHLEFYARDLARNISGTIAVDFSVIQAGAPGPELGTALEPILRQLEQGIEPLIPKIFKKEELQPVKVVTVPKLPPFAFKNIWNLLPAKAIAMFVLSPLPQNISILTQKFPELEKTFKEVGITKITDVEKLKIANLKLPALTQTLGLEQVEIAPGKFTPPKGVPVAELPASVKQRIPSEIIFVRTGGGLIDLNIALSLGSQGKPEQRVEITAGAPLQLVVKVDTPVKKMKGYIIFRAKKPKEESFNVPLNYLTASLLFAGPKLAEEQERPVNVEEKLVLLEFEYQDTGDGVYIANVQAPAVDGEYEIITVLEYEGEQIVLKEIKLITVIDPEGYIYEKDEDKETRILGAVISLYWLNPETKQYELWPAKDYQQENPQTTDVRGVYSFLVPEGYYYLKVDTPGYLSYDGKPFQVKEGSGIHVNIELKSQYWFLKIVDWKTLLLVIVILLLLYNFYKDRIREKMIMAKENKNKF